MGFLNLVLGAMAFVVLLETPLQVIGKFILWVCLINSGALAGMALYNQVAPAQNAYPLPLHQVEIAARTVTEISAVPGITRDQEGRPSGLRIDLSGYLRNYTERKLVAVTVHCRWNFSAHEQGRTALIDIPVDAAPGTLTKLNFTYKTRDYHAPGDMSEFQAHCHVKRVSEFDQWDVLGDS